MNYFFHTQRQQGLGVEMAALGNVDIFVRSGHGVDPYFHLTMCIAQFLQKNKTLETNYLNK
jgi:hypothetical protein